jgi:hypothetical protein
MVILQYKTIFENFGFCNVNEPAKADLAVSIFTWKRIQQFQQL